MANRKKTKSGNRRKQELERLYRTIKSDEPKDSESKISVATRKTIPVEQDAGVNYVRSDLIKTFTYMLGVAAVLLIAAVYFSDLSFAASIRESVGIHQISVEFPFLQ